MIFGYTLASFFCSEQILDVTPPHARPTKIRHARVDEGDLHRTIFASTARVDRVAREVVIVATHASLLTTCGS